jgi:polar amino acid transport system permease protein
MNFLDQLWIARFALLDGIVVTLEASFLSVAIGSVCGLLVGIALTYGPRPLRWFLRAYVDVVRGTPVLVIVLSAFYVPAVLGLQLGPFGAGVLALSAFCAAHVGEVLRGALMAIPRGQTEAGLSIGLTLPRVIAYVLVPQALALVAPTWVNTAVEIVKSTTLLSVIGVGEVLLSTQEIVGRNFMTLQFYVVAGIIYIAINGAIQQLGGLIERRFNVR